MPTSPSDQRTFLRDLLLILGIPAVLAGIIGYATWPWTSRPYAAASEEAMFRLATGVWDWAGGDSSCTANPQSIQFSADRSTMRILMRTSWTDSTGASHRVAIYDLSERSPSHVRGAIRGESRLTKEGKPVAWDLVLTSANTFAWHRTDWAEGALTKGLVRCPEGSDSLIPPLTPAESAKGGSGAT
jgi:hypothetical protein